jgi:endogenous inhibitor of DNA gyrase (YacG/DUF329 family)
MTKILYKNICKHCGNPFEKFIYPSQPRPHFCDRSCKSQYQADHRPVRRKLVKYTCLQCGTNFKEYPPNNKIRYFCSMICRADFEHAAIKKALKHTTKRKKS